jgi:hypothetical protein
LRTIDRGLTEAELGVHVPPLQVPVTLRLTFPLPSTFMLPRVKVPVQFIPPPVIVTVAAVAVDAKSATINTKSNTFTVFIFPPLFIQIDNFEFHLLSSAEKNHDVIHFTLY